MYKNILAIFGILLVGAGIVMAISGAPITGVSSTRWSGNTTGSNFTQGGNITAINIGVSTLTGKWASYYGNVSGTLILGDGSNNVYSWTWASGTGGEVCVSTNSTFNFTGAHNMSNGTGIDTAWGFTGTDVDSGNNTYSAYVGKQGCNLTFAQAVVYNTSNITLKGTSTFTNCAIGSNATAIVAGQTHLLAFCTVIQPLATGKDYKGQPANYEIMVATNNTLGATETYYFYAELS